MEQVSTPQQHGNTDGYRFNHFNIKLIANDLRFSRDALKPGQQIPNVTVFNSDGEPIELYDLCSDKPLLLVTGSITCPMTISAFPTMDQLQEKLGDKVNFALVYVREAHPAESYSQPETIEEKVRHASDLQRIYNTQWPVIVDDIDGPLHKALDVLPNSAHLIGQGGEILFQSLWVTDIAPLEKALTAVQQGSPISKKGYPEFLVDKMPKM